MIKLSERLETIANLIDKNETMADIGTDHGFLPVALWERGICKKIILSDVNIGPLEKASENIHTTNPGIQFDLRLGNGLETILKGEVTTLVIAGMGGVLITEILAADLQKSKSFEKTDAAIEKSVNLIMELMGKSALDSMFDLGKFLFQNVTKR